MPWRQERLDDVHACPPRRRLQQDRGSHRADSRRPTILPRPSKYLGPFRPGPSSSPIPGPADRPPDPAHRSAGKQAGPSSSPPPAGEKGVRSAQQRNLRFMLEDRIIDLPLDSPIAVDDFFDCRVAGASPASTCYSGSRSPLNAPRSAATRSGSTPGAAAEPRPGHEANTPARPPTTTTGGAGRRDDPARRNEPDTRRPARPGTKREPRLDTASTQGHTGPPRAEPTRVPNAPDDHESCDVRPPDPCAGATVALAELTTKQPEATTQNRGRELHWRHT